MWPPRFPDLYSYDFFQTQSIPAQDENELIIKTGYSKNGKKLFRKPKVSKALERDDPVDDNMTYFIKK